jgi:lipoprotein-anchoring transpeptidase ErfK/SrfK
VSKVAIVVAPAKGTTQVRPDAAVTVTASAGTLTTVIVRPAKGGDPVPGALSADRTTWTRDPAAPLPFGTTFAVLAQGVDSTGLARIVQSTFATLQPAAALSAVWNASEDQGPVGVGMPILVVFNHPVTNRAEVEKHLSVQLSKPVTGSWHWFSQKSVRWRPKTYWPSGERVDVHLDVAGVDAGGGVWGTKNMEFGFTVGPATISTVDVATDQMTVTQNGKVVRVIPVTTGKAGYLTRGGIKVIITKEPSRVMDSTTVDIPAGSPDAYHLKVFDAMRLTWSGEFLHAAPWSVYAQGHMNVSHGCTGMSNENAAWLYGVSKVGDVVRYVSSTRALEPDNGWTDWNISWPQWSAGSALA